MQSFYCLFFGIRLIPRIFTEHKAGLHELEKIYAIRLLFCVDFSAGHAVFYCPPVFFLRQRKGASVFVFSWELSPVGSGEQVVVQLLLYSVPGCGESVL